MSSMLFPAYLLQTCLKTLRIYLQNAHDHPTEKKYHKINKSNKAFMERVAPFGEAIEVLENCGFSDTGERRANSVALNFIRFVHTSPSMLSVSFWPLSLKLADLGRFPT
ncbi:hypothetical protein FOZ62_029831 [Perkinsus olseni]|uniref:PUB domain-containing protein n=1 Tax=Perkinsus olseni TaxID=32597 RepID=A0A7J6RGH5_PEROL|nr:hypothetical protein FOZ62_029831 [Perkinsus olseni]